MELDSRARGAALVTIATLAVGLRPPFFVIRVIARLVPDVLFFIHARERAIALTIDDGPHPSVTPDILASLRRYDAHATFFLLGSRAAQFPELVARIASDGHELGNHTWDDVVSARLPPAELDSSLKLTDKVLSAFGPVHLFRPGSGWVTRRLVSVVHRHGYAVVLGSVYPCDAHLPFQRWIVFDVLRRARPGAIVVLHEGRPDRRYTVDVLEAVLPALRNRGYRVTTVSELIG